MILPFILPSVRFVDFLVGLRPRRVQLGDLLEHWAVFAVGARQIADAHQEFIDDLATHELEGLAEQFRPFGPVQGMVDGDPESEATVAVAERDDTLGVLDDGRDLEPVADDPGVIQQPLDVLGLVGGDRIDVEIVEGGHRGRALLEDQVPRQPSLEQLQRLQLEQVALAVLVVQGKAIFTVVVGTVVRVLACVVAIPTQIKFLRNRDG